jgi:SAM-dependent methyltransferase
MDRDMHCPLCAAAKPRPYYEDRRRPYLRCDRCSLVFVPPACYPSLEAERAEYDLHQNRVDDAGYRAFLSRLAEPLSARLSAGARGLDFGCGPGPALAALLQDRGFEVSLYDSYYFPDTSVLAAQYDFVCATEVVEHLHHPGRELLRLRAMLRPGGWLGVMTKLVRNRDAFRNWHYKNDPTHVCFFSQSTWQWWAREHALELQIIGADVILLGPA